MATRDKPFERLRGRIAPLAAALACALAIPAVGAAEGRRHVVLVLADGDPAAAERLVDALRAQLSDLDVVLDVVRAERPCPTLGEQLAAYPALAAGVEAVAVCWATRTAADEQIVQIADASWQRLLARRIPAEDPGAQNAAIALIVRSAVEILLAGGTIGVVPEPPPPPSAEPVPAAAPAPTRAAAPPSPRARVGVEIGYAFAARSAAAPAAHGVALDAAISPCCGLEVFAGYTAWFPIAIPGRVAELTVLRHPVRAGAAWGFPLGRASLGPRVAAVLDSTTTESAVPRGADAHGRSTRALIASAEIALELRVRLVGGLDLIVAAGAELVFNRSRYVYHGTGGPEVVDAPFVAQPRAGIGLALFSR